MTKEKNRGVTKPKPNQNLRFSSRIGYQPKQPLISNMFKRTIEQQQSQQNQESQSSSSQSHSEQREAETTSATVSVYKYIRLHYLTIFLIYF